MLDARAEVAASFPAGGTTCLGFQHHSGAAGQGPANSEVLVGWAPRGIQGELVRGSAGELVGGSAGEPQMHFTILQTLLFTPMLEPGEDRQFSKGL